MILIIVTKAYGWLCFGWVLPVSWFQVSARLAYKWLRCGHTCAFTDVAANLVSSVCQLTILHAAGGFMWRDSTNVAQYSRTAAPGLGHVLTGSLTVRCCDPGTGTGARCGRT